MKPQLPLLDMALYHTNRPAFVEELRQACHTVGFFLIKHDFPDVANQMVKESRQFFQRPLVEKQQISYSKSPSFRGYMEFGVENTSGKLDAREQIEYAAEYPHPIQQQQQQQQRQWPIYERLKSPSNPWPTSYQPSLQPTTLEYAKNVCRVADCIRDSLSLALGYPPDRLKPAFEQKDMPPHWVIKLVSYPPPLQKEEEQQQQQGVGEHTDTNFLTLVLQDTVGGLQAFSQGEWIDVPTDVPQVLVCNLGEQAELWSRGYYLATPHRVVSSSLRRCARISVPLFYNPILSATIQPVEEERLESIPWDRPKDYHHWRRENNAMLPSAGSNTFKSLARSHPQVFQRHHPDLVLLEDGRILPRDDPQHE
jgi:isopenicillin N synthase-like dioxygenase